MKKVFLILGAVILVVGIGVALFVKQSQDALNQLAKTQITDVDLSVLADGVYDGSYSAFPVSVSVTVTVSDHVITAIRITKHDNGQGKPAEVIVDQVLEAQSLQVDVIAGATYSSKVILLAIRDALVP
jgi:uncharacterized protein with FMN-binding domain